MVHISACVKQYNLPKQFMKKNQYLPSSTAPNTHTFTLNVQSPFLDSWHLNTEAVCMRLELRLQNFNFTHIWAMS